MTVKSCIVLSLIVLGLCVLSAVDLSNPRDYQRAFMRVRGDVSGKEAVYHWTGKVYSMIPGEQRKELFHFEGFSVARLVEVENGWQMLTREAAFYSDPRTGEILETWQNPFTKKDVPVVQVWNDPVNQQFDFTDEEVAFISKFLPSVDMGDQLVFYMDIFPFYPSALPRKDYAQFSQSDTYQAAEFFQFFVDKAELLNETLSSVPATISWTRISPWMPFMRMGDKPGNLVFVCRGSKLMGGYEALPERIRNYVAARNPQYAHAPETFEHPNETSWTYFKKLLQQGLIKP